MKVFKPSDTIHALYIVSRSIPETATLVLYNELRSIETLIPIECSNVGGYLQANFEHEFKEGQSYELSVIDSENKTLYRGKAYATNQEDLQNYKLN